MNRRLTQNVVHGSGFGRGGGMPRRSTTPFIKRLLYLVLALAVIAVGIVVKVYFQIG
jgi:hypothetical protein